MGSQKRATLCSVFLIVFCTISVIIILLFAGRSKEPDRRTSVQVWTGTTGEAIMESTPTDGSESASPSLVAQDFKKAILQQDGEHGYLRGSREKLEVLKPRIHRKPTKADTSENQRKPLVVEPSPHETEPIQSVPPHPNWSQFFHPSHKPWSGLEENLPLLLNQPILSQTDPEKTITDTDNAGSSTEEVLLEAPLWHHFSPYERRDSPLPPVQHQAQLIPDSVSLLTRPSSTETDEDSERNGNDLDKIIRNFYQESNPLSLVSLTSQLLSPGGSVDPSKFEVLLEAVNETLNKGPSNELLSHLNKFSPRPTSSTQAAELGFGRNAYEKSLTAFVFMTFGVFLLKQIQSLSVQDRNDIVARKHGGGGVGGNTLVEQQSDLSMLFEPPLVNWTLSVVIKNQADEDEEEPSGDSSATLFRSEESQNATTVNNLVRGALNLVNAYTKEPQVMECIWSLYCTDLDKAAGRSGLYGMAARINSIGLRLIMDQIPAELTFDVLLRSLLGWDGLPCMEMFPKCHGSKAKLMLQAATSGNSTSV